MKDNNVTHPENKIVLLDGRELECYPGERHESSGDGVFLKNAFLFYRNAERILSDSRMFLAPVPIQSGIAYTGTLGFTNPTLGVYIEWWRNCEADLTKDVHGEEALLFRMSGSPLSGRNSCSCVYPDGRLSSMAHPCFRLVWTSFVNINRRYDDAKGRYEAYSLEEVVDILRPLAQHFL